MIRLQTSAGSKTLIPRGIMRPDGSKRGFARVAMKTAGGNIDLWTPEEAGGGGSFTVTMNQPDVVGYSASGMISTVYTAVASVTVEGAVGALTYAWSKVSGAAEWEIVSPTSATTSFRIPLDPDTNDSAVFQVTVTDSLGRTATATVNAFAANYYFGGY